MCFQRSFLFPPFEFGAVIGLLMLSAARASAEIPESKSAMEHGHLLPSSKPGTGGISHALLMLTCWCCLQIERKMLEMRPELGSLKEAGVRIQDKSAGYFLAPM